MKNESSGKKGLVFGKFLPPHKGHIHLIQEAASQVEELTVLVCSIKAEPIPGYLRYGWMKRIFPKLRVLHVTDENPQFPEEHPDFWQIWTHTFEKNMPEGIDILFTSEHYGDEMARHLNCQHIMIDQPRETVPISATMIRENPYEHWEFIPEVVRPYFIKRVVLTGPESSGKSVLSKKLAAHYQTNYLEEYGRTYVEKFGIDVDLMDIAHIAGGHIFLEEQASLKSNKVLFCDTDLIVTQIWSEIFCGYSPEWIHLINHTLKYDLFLLLAPDIPWVDDGTRQFSHYSNIHFKRLKDELESRNLPYVVIEGGYEERFQEAVRAVDKLL